MDFSLEHAAVHRARSALDLVYGNTGAAARRKAFMTIAGELLKHESASAAYERLQYHPDALVEKAVAQNLAAIGSGSVPHDMAALAAGFVESIRERSIFDVIAGYARPVEKVGRVLVGTGAATTNDTTAEAGNIVWADSNISIEDTDAFKTAAIFAASNELVKLGGKAFERLFAIELESCIIKALNSAVLDHLLTGAGSAAAGATPLASLQAGIAALDSPEAVVVVASPADVASLILSDANRAGAGLRGGELVSGLSVVPTDAPLAGGMVVIEASKAAVFDGGLEISQAQHADLVLAYDSHGEPISRVSLFQTGATALRAVRSWAIGGAPQVVVVS